MRISQQAGQPSDSQAQANLGDSSKEESGAEASVKPDLG